MYKTETFEIFKNYGLLIPSDQFFVFETNKLQEFRDAIFRKMQELKVYSPEYTKEFGKFIDDHPDDDVHT